MIRSTTVICVRKDGKVALAGDGQVTLGETVIKQSARKIRRLYNGQILAGFAGSTADAFALFSRFESKLEEFRGNLSRASVELAKEWRRTGPCGICRRCSWWQTERVRSC